MASIDFDQCGTIREIKLTHVNSATTVATVEFHDRVSIEIPVDGLLSAHLYVGECACSSHKG